MRFPARLSLTSALLVAIGGSAQAAPTAASSLFATGPAGTSGADSVTIGDGSVWIEYGNGADLTGAFGSSTIVRYGFNGAVQATISIPGLSSTG